jgi:uncharacterized repeat protein (TIGR02543 family)
MGHRGRLLLALLGGSLAVVTGCRDLNIPDGRLHCSAAKHCPEPYVCHADNNLCYRPSPSDAAVDHATDLTSDRPTDLPSTDLGAAGNGADSGTDGGVSVPQVTITIQRSGNGSITGPGIACTDAACTVSVDSGSNLVLEAVPGSDSDFKTWSGCTNTNAASCSLVGITSATQVTATFALKGANFVVVKDGNGAGTVTATWAGGGTLSCGAACSAVVPAGTVVTLQATPDVGSTLAWGAPCTGSAACAVTIAPTGVTTLGATFALSKVALTVEQTGTGTVTGTNGVSCADASCAVPVDYGSTVVLTAMPGANYDFGAWTGCTTTSGASCTVTSVKAAAKVGVTYALKKLALTIQRSGNGSVTGAGGINCTTASCAVPVDAGSSVVLTAVPGSDSDFQSWSGCTTTSGTTCTVSSISAAKQVSVTFALKNASFVISRQGNGSGTVTATWAGGGSLNCGAACSANIPQGTVVTLQGTPGAQSTLAWGAPCTGSGACTVTVGATGVTITAAFSLVKYSLTVARTGLGSVAATAGVVCGTFPCTSMLDAGTNVMFTATPAAEYTFVGWTGCSTATGAVCNVTSLAGNATVTATFAIKQYPLTIQRTGNGSVTGTGINCTAASCVVMVNSGSTVALTAVPGADSNFSTWTGCSPTNSAACTTPAITAAATVTAAFALKSASFTISKTGNGSGTVTATWAGGGSLNCGATCSASITQGTVVTLTAAPSAGSTLTSWGAAGCTGTGPCMVTVAAGGTTVSPAFTLGQFLLSVSLSGPASTGSVLATTGGIGINCGATCSALVNYGTTVQLVEAPSSSGVFSSWTGCDSITANNTTCNVTVTVARTVGAAFKRSNGNPCGSTADCSSGFCVGSTCCSSACPGVGVANGCDVSCSSGTCQHTAAKTACGIIRPAVSSTPTGFNDIAEYCDGSGNCIAPTVACNDGSTAFSCALSATAVCCYHNTGQRTSDGFPIFQSYCGDPTNCGGIAVLWGQLCASNNDCPTGLLCCSKHAGSANWAVCTAPGACVANPNGDSSYPICDPNAPVCQAGLTCNPDLAFYVCN